MKKLNIAFPITGLPVPSVKGGAIQTGIQQIIDENEVRNKVNITVYSIYDEKAELESKKYKYTKFEFIKINKNTIKIRRALNKLFRLCKINKQLIVNKEFIGELTKKVVTENFDYIVVKNSIELVKPIKDKTKVKVALQLHNDFLNDSTYKNKTIYKLSDKLVANSFYIKNRIDTISNKVDSKFKKNIYVNKNCTDYDLFSKSIAKEVSLELKRKYEIKNEIVIVFSGRIIPEKGIKELIEALIIMKRKNLVKFKLIIVGSKWFGNTSEDNFSNKLKKIAEEISTDIVFAGYIPYNELPKIYSISDIAVVPSIWEEPAGRVVLEAQAAGVPVIVSDAGGISDYIDSNNAIVVKRGTDFVVNLSKEIEKLSLDDERRVFLSDEARKFSSYFTPQKYYEDIIDILEEEI
ncbi:glycosyltransferase family 4 protein [Exiguobacterium sp. TDN 0502]|uniref:glycosyltransferase family 4 protein n=1 Tax=Exiguobacterium sp. TDN 0502 TaxID=3420731 RepID=UPI003D77BB97